MVICGAGAGTSSATHATSDWPTSVLFTFHCLPPSFIGKSYFPTPSSLCLLVRVDPETQPNALASNFPFRLISPSPPRSFFPLGCAQNFSKMVKSSLARFWLLFVELPRVDFASSDRHFAIKPVAASAASLLYLPCHSTILPFLPFSHLRLE